MSKITSEEMAAVANIESLALSEAEIVELTRYKRPVDQMRVLAMLGITAHRLHDNTVRVLRRDLLTPAGQHAIAAAKRPKLVF